ncbi:MAG: UvrD-helicase domain-containing protein [Prevotella sp.]|nr:UvrD-helicase domain-containing protein [Prevotella sp.]
MKGNEDRSWQPDATQQTIIKLHDGCHLVLAPPGCGKTQILAERIRHAHGQGVAYEDMLCLTFTNRAARGMRERIQENINDVGTTDVFVGNVHRFCSRFLFENQIVAAESAIIDDDTTVSILATYLNEEEQSVANNKQRRGYYNQIVFFSHLMYEVRHGIAKPLRLHPESATKEDIAVMQTICRLQDKAFTAEMMMDIYDNNDFYLDFVQSEAFDLALRQQAVQTMTKMKYAHAYEAYKLQNNLLDFEDLLEQSYVALMNGKEYKRYPWIQVDEVQDLNLLQLAIIDALSTCNVEVSGAVGGAGTGTIMYLGDEMQAIFSFMGARLQILELLKQRCNGHIHHLGVNHRSPKYLVDLFNTYAVKQLGFDADLLPQPKGGDEGEGDELRIVSSEDLETEVVDVARMAISLSDRYPEETTAVIVNANNDADSISQKLTEGHQPHFKVSGMDLFSTPEVKLIMAHLSVLDNERNFLAWSRLMKGMMVCQTNTAARQFVHQLEVRAIVPTDFFEYTDSTYLQDFLKVAEQQDLVVFDTETTGLNVFEDDIIQIAAERIRAGKSVGKFSVHIQTDREIPTMLGDVVNPIIEERRHQQLYPPAEALRMFLDFIGNDVLLGHNADYDYHIMDYNLRRYLPAVEWQREHPRCFDSLKLIRLLRPDLKAFKLKLLLKELGLEGENSHLADDDVNATVSLVGYCQQRGQELLDSQREFLGRKNVQERIRLLRQNYGPLYAAGRQQMYNRLSPQETPALIAEMQRFYGQLKTNGWVKDLPKMNYIYRFLEDDIIDVSREPSLVEQLGRHIMELNTFKEADLCGSSTIEDRIFVTTIHKAKGLEFDNVIVFDVVDGRLPSYFSEGNPKAIAEDARKLYVAMSRAKRRLYITHCMARKIGRDIKPQRLSRFLEPVLSFFKQ